MTNELVLSNGDSLSYHHDAIYHHNHKMNIKWSVDGDKIEVDLKEHVLIIPYAFIPQSVWKVLIKGLYILKGNN